MRYGFYFRGQLRQKRLVGAAKFRSGDFEFSAIRSFELHRAIFHCNEPGLDLELAGRIRPGANLTCLNEDHLKQKNRNAKEETSHSTDGERWS